MNTYPYILKFDIENSIFYSGDTCENNIYLVDSLRDGNWAYQDTCIDNSKDNVYTSLRKLSELVPEKYRSLVYCIHIDGENFIREARKYRFNLVNVN